MSEGREIFLSLIGNEAHNLMPNQNWNIDYLWRCSLFIVSSTCTNTNPTCPDVHSSCWVSSRWSEVPVPRCLRCFADQGSGCPCCFWDRQEYIMMMMMMDVIMRIIWWWSQSWCRWWWWRRIACLSRSLNPQHAPLHRPPPYLFSPSDHYLSCGVYDQIINHLVILIK